MNNASVDEVKLITFSSTASTTLWLTKTQAIAAINAAGLGSGTDYDAALFEALDGAVHAFDTQPLSAGDDRVVYFLSDGVPTEPGGSDNGIQPIEEANDWIPSLIANNVDKVVAIGVGGIGPVEAGQLEPIAWAPGETQATITAPAADPNVLIIDDTDFSALGATLTATLPNSSTGNVITDGAVDDSFGADGGRIHSIKVGDTTYTWNGVTGAGSSISVVSDAAPELGSLISGDTSIVVLTGPRRSNDLLFCRRRRASGR